MPSSLRWGLAYLVALAITVAYMFLVSQLMGEDMGYFRPAGWYIPLA